MTTIKSLNNHTSASYLEQERKTNETETLIDAIEKAKSNGAFYDKTILDFIK